MTKERVTAGRGWTETYLGRSSRLLRRLGGTDTADSSMSQDSGCPLLLRVRESRRDARRTASPAMHRPAPVRQHAVQVVM